jgi:hypothetical protein
MPKHTIELNPDDFDDDWQSDKKDDWQGNNVAFTCRSCGRVFIVSEQIHSGRRKCECGEWEGVVQGGRKSNGYARLIRIKH